jgi:hypothetical protein
MVSHKSSRTGLPIRMQGAALDYLGGGTWRLWLHTNDHVYGTYLKLYSNGRITRVTVRDGYDDEEMIKPEE